ncbi:hypothetical protein B5X24_HaOG202076 [Helicoverpa armigera]|uniref:Uncharacterized protein n=1 Tax=Helicoverpa armigera TaxID=29058 RepID=A0A2W1C072_HELAM|nr:hypothetical protein B5X24_HaOG202076 [Helicoverpa armigera]
MPGQGRGARRAGRRGEGLQHSMHLRPAWDELKGLTCSKGFQSEHSSTANIKTGQVRVGLAHVGFRTIQTNILYIYGYRAKMSKQVTFVVWEPSEIFILS